MAFLAQFFPDLIHAPRRERAKLFAMMGLFFLVVCAVGILRPIKNSLALDGLGATAFYKVYLVSAGVVLFGPIYKGLAERVPSRTLFPLIALFFASNLVLFRILYVDGSAAFGMLFYGWYDLFSAALVTQFFMATQLFLNARSAKQAYPLVIGGGALGATLGGMITGVTAERIGAPNLMLVAAAIIVIFAAGLPFIYQGATNPRETTKRTNTTTVDALWHNKHIRFIAASVILTVIVKELVDYQFNMLSQQVYQTRDAVSAFQGKFNAITQWLPLVFVLLLHPVLKRFGVGIAIMMLPAALLITNVGLAIWWGLFAAATAKGAETALRYSAERAGREILYLPVPEQVRLTAKPYIDVVIEKGIGKVLSAAFIFVLLQLMSARQIAYVSLALAAVSLVLAVALRKEYVRTLAQAIQGRFVTLRGVFASLLDASTLPRVRAALQSDDALQVAFALDLLEQAPSTDAQTLVPELRALLRHPSEPVRERAVSLMGRVPDAGDLDAIEAALSDESAMVREAAARALIASSKDSEAVLMRLLDSEQANVRTAVLAQLTQLELSADVRARIAKHYAGSNGALLPSRESRIESAYAAQALGPEGWRVLLPLMSDSDPAVVNATLRAASALRNPELIPACIRALRSRATRDPARTALQSYGETALMVLTKQLLDPNADPGVRRIIPSVLARVPSEQSVMALLRAITARETDQVLDFRAIKALGKLRARHPELWFPPDAVRIVLQREAAAAERFARARYAVTHARSNAPAARLLVQALTEAWRERRECAFRLLALLYRPPDVLNAYTAISGTDARARGNALEWLEHEIGYELMRTLAPVLTDPDRRTWSAPRVWEFLQELSDDEDSWIAICARGVTAQDSGDSLPASPQRGGTLLDRDVAMDIIERVFLLQRVDLLQGARSAHLALLAAIAEELEIAEGTNLLEQGRPAAAMYILVRGAIELRGVGDQQMQLQDGTAFGTWALIDDAPSMISARATETSQLLRINRTDFFDLLEDTPELALGLLQGLARRVRTLVA